MASSVFIWPGYFTNNGSQVVFTLPAAFPDGTAPAPSITFSSQTGTGLFYIANNTIGFTNAGTNTALVGGLELRMASGAQIGFGSASTASAGTADTILVRDAANILALKNSTNLQTFRVYDVTGTGYTAYGGAGVSTYKNVLTAGWGVPSIVAEARSVAQTAAVASVATYTVGAADGSFEVCANVLVTTATTHTFNVECAFTDEGNTARILTMPFTLIAGAAIVTSVANGNGAVPYLGIRQQIRCKTGTSITIRTQAAGTYTTVTYNVEGCIAQVA